MDPIDDEPKMIPCPDCGGTGKIPASLDNLPGPTPFLEIDCPTCNGTGAIRQPDC
jgi:DnaJ-class molecular chaperone